MAWVRIPLPQLTYLSADEAQAFDQIGAKLVDGYIDELGHIRKRPGLQLFVDLGESVRVDGLYWWDEQGVLIAVSSGNIYKISNSAGSFSDLGGDDLQTSGRVRFATDGSTVVMANGGQMVTYDNAVAPTFMVDADAPTDVNNITWIDGYLLADTNATNGEVTFTSPTDITDWTSTDLFTAETNPDAIQFMGVKWREVTLFGKKGIDIYYNDGVTPFVRLDGGYTERGTIAKNSPINLRGQWYWMDDDRRVSRLTDRTPETISGPIDNDIRHITSISDGSGMKIDLGTRSFYVLNFNTENRTFAFDATTNNWGEWGNWNSSTSSYDKFIGNVSEYAKDWDFHLVGSISDGKIYKVRNDVFTDGGATIRTQIRTGHITHGTNNKKKSNALRLRFKRGVGNVNNTDPEVLVRWRSDGKSWSNWHSKSLGKSGDTDFFIDFNRMGIYRTRQYEIVHADDSDFILTGAEESIEALDR